MLQDGEESVQKDLEPDWRGLRAIEHQRCNVKDDVGLHDFYLHAELINRSVTKFV